MGAIYALPITVLRRRLDFRRVSIVETLQNATRVIATVGLALFGLDAPALVFGCTAGMVVALVAALFYAPVPWPRWRGGAVRDLLPYGGPAGLATFAWTGFRNGDYAVIGAVLGPAQAGLYWRGYQLAVEYQGKVAVPMAQMAFPVLARTDGTEELLGLRRRMVHLQTVVLFPLLVLLLVLAPVVVPWLFGPAWEGAVVPTQILVAGGAASLVINAAGSALMAEGRAKALLGYGVAHFVVYVGAVVAVAHMGLAAVAIAGSVDPRNLPRRRLRRPAAGTGGQLAGGALAGPRSGADRVRRPGRDRGAARARAAGRRRAGASCRCWPSDWREASPTSRSCAASFPPRLTISSPPCAGSPRRASASAVAGRRSRPGRRRDRAAGPRDPDRQPGLRRGEATSSRPRAPSPRRRCRPPAG